MNSRVLNSVSRILALACVVSIPIGLAAQAAPASSPAPPSSPSRWDIFLGYSYLDPNGPIPNTGTPPGAPGSTYGEINWGGQLSFARYFNRILGIELVGDEHMQSEDVPVGDNNASFNSNDDMSGGAGGIIFRVPTEHFTPFFHVLSGAERVGSTYNPEAWGTQSTFGAGLDVETPLFHHHLAYRFAEADYQLVHADGNNVKNFRLSTGAVLHLGSIAPPPQVGLACAVSPGTVFPGDPVTVTVTPSFLEPKLNAVYAWSGTGVTGNGTTANVATGTLAAGTYTVGATVKEGKPGKEGQKPWENASCSATFTVKAFEPPTVGCSANPTTLNPGDSSTITASGVSPQNRPLTYSYSATAGAINGSGATATFSSAGAPTGAVGITCNVADDKGQTATANTSVTIAAPYVAPAPHTQTMCSISFDKDKERPTRVDNEAKACLDQVALDLQKQTDAKAVLVGTANDKEKAKTAKEQKAAERNKHMKVEDFAAQRAVNAKAYLVSEKGIDASRISTATGSTDGQTVEDYLVPSGATFTGDVTGTTPVDESAVKPQERKPLVTRHHAH